MRYVWGVVVAIVVFFASLLVLGGRAGAPELAIAAVVAAALGWLTARRAGRRPT